MKISSPIPRKKARLEIVPLIDIMFFLLASFMMVSLTMTKQRSISVNLPGAASAQPSMKVESISLAVKPSGQVFLEKQEISLPDLEQKLKSLLAANKDLPVQISGDAATPHGAMVTVLDYVRRCGVSKVAFNVKPAD